MAAVKKTFNFGGALKQTAIPGVYPEVQYQESAASGASAANGVVLGDSLSGQPRQLMAFSSPAEAKQALAGGSLLEGVLHAMNPGGGFAPQILAMSVNEKTQGERAFKKNGVTVLTAKSAVYGKPAGNISLKLSQGSLKESCRLEAKSPAGESAIDNIACPLFRLEAAQGEAALEGGRFTVKALNIDIDLTDLSAYELALQLESHEDVSVEILDEGACQSVRALQLDTFSSSALKDGLAVSAHALAILKAGWQLGCFDSQTAFAEGAYTVPDMDSYHVPFTGGASGAYTLNEWEAALEVLEGKDIQFIACTSENPAVHSLIRQHCERMGALSRDDRSRQAFVGGALGLSVEERIAAAKTLGSPSVSYCAPGFYSQDLLDASEAPALKLYSSAYTACRLMGLHCALPLNESATNKDLGVLSWEELRTPYGSRDINEAETEQLLAAGVTLGGYSQRAPKCVRSLTSWQQGGLLRCETTIVREIYYIKRDLQARLQQKIGRAGTKANYGDIKMIALGALGEYRDFLQIINSYSNLAVTVSGDLVKVQFDAAMAAPINFINPQITAGLTASLEITA